MKLESLYFSPTGNTRKVVKAFEAGFGGIWAEADITRPENRPVPAEKAAPVRTGGPAAPSEDGEDMPQALPALTLFAGPVYGGRSFKLFTSAIAKREGKGQAAVLLCTYGGRHYDMALADLYEAAANAGFAVVACGAFIGEHSFSKQIQTGRPDGDDLALAQDFGRKVRDLLSDAAACGKPLPVMAREDVPQRPVDVAAIGMHRDRLGHLDPNRPAPDERCLHCGACAAVCPLGLIDVNDSDSIRPGCLKCNACVKTCPVGSMQFRQKAFREVAQNCEETFGREDRQPQVWFAASR